MNLSFLTTFRAHDGDDGQVDAPLWMGLLILVLFTTIMAGLFCWIEGWDFGTSLYFQYITYLTIGFGDVVPEKEEVKKIIFSHLLKGLRHGNFADIWSKLF